MPCRIRRIGPEEIALLNDIGMSYASDYGFEFTHSQDRNGWRFELGPKHFSPPFERQYDWNWSALDDVKANAAEGLVWAAFPTAEDAVDSPRTIGMVELRSSPWNDSLWIQSLYVDTAFRRSGVGSRLLQRAVRVARNAQVRALFVETQTSNGPAIDFYVANGFSLCGFNDHQYTNDDTQYDEIALFFVKEMK